MRIVRLLLIGSLALLAQAALAQDYGRPGLYAALNGVYGIETFDHVPDSLVDNAWGVSGRIGYRMSPHLAAEAQYEYSGDFLDGGADFTQSLLSANGKFYFLADQIQPYALAGIGADWGNISGGGNDRTGFLFRVGGGVDWYFNQNFGLLLEALYNKSTDDVLDDADYLSLGWGVFYRF